MNSSARSGATPQRIAPDSPTGGSYAFPGLVLSLLLVVVLPWRTEVYYSGGADLVVVSKALLTMLALALSWVHWLHSDTRRILGIRPALFVVGYMAVSLLGAVAADQPLPTLVLTIRMGLLLLVIALLLASHTLSELVLGLRDATFWVGVLVGGSGLSSLVSEGRLGGGVLPLNPNQLAMLYGVSLLVFVWSAVVGQRRRFTGLSILVLSALIIATGSRTGLVAAVLALALCVSLFRRRPAMVYAVGVATLPAAFYVMAGTDVFSRYFLRGGDSNVLTLNSRTIAWSAAFSRPYDFWETWFGSGLSVKTISVTGTYWDSQVLDSSWVSAFVQAGALGLVLMALWSVVGLVAALRMPQPARAVVASLVVYCLFWSVTATGLLDAYVLFLLMFLATMSAERTTWSQQDPTASAHASQRPSPDGVGRAKLAGTQSSRA